MRQLTDHRVNECNENITVSVVDEPGPGGASREYEIVLAPGHGINAGVTSLRFQDGPVGEVGTNGVTHEALLAVIVDRLRGFQKGPHACRENALALTKIEEAMHWLRARTIARLERGVEGTRAP